MKQDAFHDYWQASNLYQRGELAAADQICLRYLFSRDFINLHGCILEMQGNLTEAITAYEQAAQLGSDAAATNISRLRQGQEPESPGQQLERERSYFLQRLALLGVKDPRSVHDASALFTYLWNLKNQPELTEPIRHNAVLHGQTEWTSVYFCSSLLHALGELEPAANDLLLLQPKEQELEHLPEQLSKTSAILSIVVLTDDLWQKLRECGDKALTERTLFLHIHCEMTDAETAYYMTCDRLECNEALHFSRAYYDELQAYVLDVYTREGVELQQDAFVDDMVPRCTRAYFETHAVRELAGPESVPFRRTRLPEILPPAEAESATAETKKEETEAPKGSGVAEKVQIPETVREFYEADKPLLPAASPNEKGSVLLLFLSDRKINAVQPGTYISEGKKYLGINTNDAPVQYLCDKALEEGREHAIERVLCITTQETETKPEGLTSLDGLRLLLSKYARKNGAPMPEIRTFRYNFKEEPGKKSSAGSMDALFPELVWELTKLKNKDYYIDYTGGPRNVTFYLTGIARYLQFFGNNCKEIVYSDYTSRSVRTLIPAYRIFELVAGLDEFTSTGMALKLSKITDSSIDDSAAGLFRAINKFSQDLSICQTSEIEENIIAIDREIEKLRSAESGSPIVATLLQNVLPNVRERLHLDKIIVKKNQKSQINYPELIKWCVDVRLFQQALTFYVEKLPKYYFTNGVVSQAVLKKMRDVFPEEISLKNLSSQNLRDSQYVKAFYTFLFDSFAPVKQKLAEMFIRKLQQCCTLIPRIAQINKLPPKYRNANDMKNCIAHAYNQEKNNSIIKQAKELAAEVREKRITPAGDEGKLISKYQENEDEIIDAILRNLGETDKAYRNCDFLESGNIWKSRGIQAVCMPDFLMIVAEGRRYPKREKEQNNYTRALLETGSSQNGRREPNRTYGRKANAAFRLLEQMPDQKDLAQVMRYYLAIKILRNTIAHSSGENRDDTEDDAIKLLSYSEIKIKKPLDVSNIRDLLRGALAASEKAVKDAREKKS